MRIAAVLPLLAVMACAAVSCRNSEGADASVDEFYNLSYADEGTLSDVFSEVELVPLQYGGESYPTEVDILTVTPDIIMIETNSDILHVFDKDGRYRSCSTEKMGPGPEEFQYSTDFSLNEWSRHIEVLELNNVKVYDKDFNFINSYKVPEYEDPDNKVGHFWWGISDLSATKHLMKTPGSRFYFFEYDSTTGKLGKKVCDYTDDIIAPTASQTHHFFKMPDGERLFVPDGMTCKVYSFNSENLSIHPKIQFELGDDAITRQKIERLGFNESELAAFLLKCDDDILSRTMLTSGNIVALVKKGWTLRTMYTVFIDRNTGKKVRVNMFKNDKRTSPMFGDVSEGYAYAAMLKEEIMESPELLLDKADQIDSIMQNVEDDTFILMKYKFK